MTEEEAKNKWCPFARVGTGYGTGMVAVNRGVSPPSEMEALREMTFCVASKCMARRWNVVAPVNNKGEPLYDAQPTHGRCGLAGGPI
jgi:hypothetical protein